MNVFQRDHIDFDGDAGGLRRVDPGQHLTAQIAAILLGGFAGLFLCRAAPPPWTGHIAVPVSRTAGLVALTAFFLLLAGLPVLRGLGISQGIASSKPSTARAHRYLAAVM